MHSVTVDQKKVYCWQDMKIPKKVGNKSSSLSQKKENLENKIAELESQIDTMIYDYNKERSAVLVAEIILGVACLAIGYAMGKFL